MRFPILAACVLVACLVAAVPVPAASAGQDECPPKKKKPEGPPPDCSKCSALPMLYRELLEQEFLRNLFKKWVTEKYGPGTVELMQRRAKELLDQAMKGTTTVRPLYGVLAPQGTGGSGGGAAPAYGTDLSHKSCGLVEYVRCKKTTGDGKEEVQEVQVPITPAEVRAKLCEPIADYVLAHEGYHQKTCKASWAEHGSDKFLKVDYVAEDDLAAYEVGIGVLRQHIAKLARDCEWSGSTNKRKPDGTMTVPTPDEILKLKDNVRKTTGQLRRKSKP